MVNKNKVKQPEKAKYSLERIKAVFHSIETLNMTYSAMQGQHELGFNDQDVVDVIQSLTNADFYKSMPPMHGNFSAWQDVYKPEFKNIKLYIKFQVDRRSEMIISFKAR